MRGMLSNKQMRQQYCMCVQNTLVTTGEDIEYNYPKSCNCTRCHIVTEDLNIVRDKEVKHVLQNGTKYHPPKIKWKSYRNAILDALSFYYNKWCKRDGADKKKALNNFMTKFMNILDLPITLFEKTFIHNKTKTNLSVSMNKHQLKEIGTSFVFVTVDKASNNVV